MSDRIDKKLEQVAVAEFTYRHEAEFAAGFLTDAGIPHRLQIDDAGGDLGAGGGCRPREGGSGPERGR
jgi:hypothetical protein